MARFFYAMLLSGYFGLLVLLPAWYGWLSPPQLISPRLALLILGLPLFAPLRGLLHARRYTIGWSLFLAPLYLAHGCMEAYSNPQARWLALAEVGLSLCWLGGGIAYLRTRQPQPV